MLRDESISRQHAAIVHDDNESYLHDIGSASGTFLNHERVRPDQPVKLHDGAAISLGDCRATYTFRVAKAAAAGGGAGSGGKRKRPAVD